MNKLSIIGAGFVGSALYNGFSPYFDIKIYDKFIKGFSTLQDTVDHAEVLFICVPTPFRENYEQDLSSIYDVINSINEVTKERKILVIKSTIIPGTTRKLADEFKQFDFIFNPEFLTERTALNDFLNQPRIVLGTDDPGIDGAHSKVEELYRVRFKYTPIFKVKYEEAELLKYMCNCYFATKVIFMNQIYKICEKIGVEYENVRQLFVGDNRITDSHTKVPGFDFQLGFGGKCVIPESLLLRDDGKFITILGLYHKFIRHHIMPKVQSCNSECNELDFKNIKQVTRRKAIEEELIVFETENGKFTCSREHLIPIYRNDILQVIQAKDVLETDEVVISDEKIYCCQGCGREAHYILAGKPWCEKISAKCPEMKKRNSIGTKKSLNTDSYREKRRLKNWVYQTDEYKKSMSIIINKLYDDPELNLRGKVSEGVKKAFEEDPTNRKRQAKTMKDRNRNWGDSNGMKKLEAKAKVSKTRKKMFEDPNERKKVAVSVAKAWVDGKFEGVRTGRCKWYRYEHTNGNIYKVQGTWELAFIKWLDENNLSFKCHKGRISYFFSGIERSYYPDFWIDDWNCYVDVKCEQFYNEEKTKAIEESNPNIKFKTLFSENLKEIGVILNEKTKDFKDIEC